MLLITGGDGFIGPKSILDLLASPNYFCGPAINLAKLTYVGNLEALVSLVGCDWHYFVQSDIGGRGLLESLLAIQPQRVLINVADESLLDKAPSFHVPCFEHSILSNGPVIDIEWPIDGQPQLMPQDASGRLLLTAEMFE